MNHKPPTDELVVPIDMPDRIWGLCVWYTLRLIADLIRSLVETNIAALLGISRSTLYRRMESYGLTLQGYSTYADDELDRIVHQIKTAHPNDGEVMVAAHMKSRGIHVPRARLRAAIHRLDPGYADIYDGKVY